MRATSEPSYTDSDDASGLINRVRWPVLLFLVGICGVWAGADLQQKVDSGQRLSLVERMIEPVRAAPTNVVKVISDPQHLKSLEVDPENRIAAGELYVVGQDTIPVDADYLYSRYDADHNTISVVLRNLSTNEIKHQWVWPYEALEQIYHAWLRRHEKSFAYADQSFGQLLKAGLQSPTLLDDGRLVVPVGQALCCFDRARKLQWISNEYSHHSIEVGPDGSIWTCSIVPRENTSFREDQIVQIDSSTGKTLYRRTIKEIFLATPEHDYSHHNAGQRDPFHINDVQPMMHDTPFWKAGDLFLSLRSINRVLLYRPSTDRILWSNATHWSQQHDVEAVDESTVTVFDNNVMKKHRQRGYRFKQGEFNRCVAYDFRTGQYTSMFEDIFRACDCRTEREGRLKWFKKQKLLFIELSEQSFFVVADLATQQSYRMMIPGNEEGRAARNGWYRLIVD